MERRTSGLLASIARRDPYWGAQLVVLVAILVDVTLPEKVTLGPTWLLPSIEGALLLALRVGTGAMEAYESPRRRQFALGMIALVSAVNAFSLAALVHLLLHGHHENGRNLILAGALLWITNVLLFGLWYWELDRGGPVRRRSSLPGPPDFLFPQMATPELKQSDWEPSLVDYLYVSFTNATAFSPTDTMPLTPWAKTLMSLQSLISLVTVGLVIARAVNILS
jgi:uncharacterized membrane protein